MNRIPVRNIYFLLLYAWERLDAADVLRIKPEKSPDLADLIARVLIAATRRVLREGLDRSYIEYQDELPVLRGQLDISTTVSKALARQGRVAVRVDEFVVDNLLNRILRATISRLARASNVSREHRHELGELIRRLAGVSSINLSRSDFRKAQVHGNNRFYRFLMSLCQLAYENLLPSEEAGSYLFQEFYKDEKQFWRVFQDFVRNFYRTHLSGCTVSGEQVAWDLDSDDQDVDLLPSMNTDITLRWPSETVVIDTKYYSEVVTSYRSKERLHTSNLYQLYAYLRNMEANGAPDSQATGVLLYPDSGRSLATKLRISGHTIMATTVDLDQPWDEIHKVLIAIANEARATARPVLH